MRSERLGMRMVAAVTVVMLLIIAYVFHHDRQNRLREIRTQGTSLSRILSKLPFEDLIGASGTAPMELVRATQANTAFAYGVVVSPVNGLLAEIVQQGVVPPMVPLDATPAAWFGERLVESDFGDKTYYEYFAPVLRDGELAAHVRVGYAEPSLRPSAADLPVFGWIALPIFLLAPLFYYVVKREVRPLAQASERIRSLVEESNHTPVELKPSAEIRDFMHGFNRLIEATEHRVKTLESENKGVMTSTKVLSYQKARIESVLESIPQAIIVLDESSVATYASEKLVRMLNIEPSSIIGKKPHEWCTQTDLLTFLSLYAGRTVRGNANELLELTPEHNPDSQISVTAYPLFSPHDRSEVYGTLVVVSDVTSETLAKQARKELVAQLSHELKTPLHVIGMYAEMLLDPEENTDELRVEAGNVISDEVERVTALINNMLSMSRIEMGNVQIERRRTRLGDLLGDIWESVGQRLEEDGLRCSLELPGDLSAVNIDKEMLRVAINNLLTNAVKYNRPGGEVVLGAEENDEQLRIYVRDTGLGISEEDQACIFEKFYRSSNDDVSAVRGHGLGLALTKDIVQMHLGEISVTSEPGVGSEFSIYLKKTPTLMKEAA